MFKRIFLVIMDSVGAGELPDAEDYGDIGSNTLKNISIATGGLNLPTLEALGLGNITDILGVPENEHATAGYTKMAERSVGKDTMTGHWELMGLNIDVPFQTFTETGFPKPLIEALEQATNRKIVGNKSASGTDILDEYGEHQIKTGDLIVYTSADSVLQIAAHEEYVGLDELYKACEIARALTLKDEFKVGRVIARPFIGAQKGAFKRTSNRHDYALKPIGKTTLNALEDAGYDVVGFGKIHDIYDGEGITQSIKHPSNKVGMENYIAYTNTQFNGLAFINLVDFDALYGHRRDAHGYKEALESFDTQLKVLIENLKDDDLLLITADHGNDPTHAGTDHTREYVPLLVYNKNIQGKPLDIRDTFADVAATIAENFNVEMPINGQSFLKSYLE